MRPSTPTTSSPVWRSLKRASPIRDEDDRDDESSSRSDWCDALPPTKRPRVQELDWAHRLLLMPVLEDENEEELASVSREEDELSMLPFWNSSASGNVENMELTDTIFLPRAMSTETPSLRLSYSSSNRPRLRRRRNRRLSDSGLFPSEDRKGSMARLPSRDHSVCSAPPLP